MCHYIWLFYMGSGDLTQAIRFSWLLLYPLVLSSPELTELKQTCFEQLMFMNPMCPAYVVFRIPYNQHSVEMM